METIKLLVEKLIAGSEPVNLQLLQVAKPSSLGALLKLELKLLLQPRCALVLLFLLEFKLHRQRSDLGLSRLLDLSCIHLQGLAVRLQLVIVPIRPLPLLLEPFLEVVLLHLDILFELIVLLSDAAELYGQAVDLLDLGLELLFWVLGTAVVRWSTCRLCFASSRLLVASEILLVLVSLLLQLLVLLLQ